MLNSEIKDQIGKFYIVKHPTESLMYEEIFHEVDVPTLVKMAREGFDETSISSIFKSPNKAQSHAIRSLKEKCAKMIQAGENGIQKRLAEKKKLTKLIDASRGYIKSSKNPTMIDEDKVGSLEADLTRIDQEVNALSEDLAKLKTRRFQIPKG